MPQEKILIHYRKWGDPVGSLCGQEGYKVGFWMGEEEDTSKWTKYRRCANCIRLGKEGRVEGSTYERRSKG